MKVVTSKQMAHIESQAYRDGASENDFMEEAGSGVALVVQEYIERNNLDKHVILLCGKGNNAGDAYVTGIHLLHLEYHVSAIQVVPISECSQLCQQNHYRFLTEGGSAIQISSTEEIGLPSKGVIVDGLFGTGFHGKVEEPFASIIHIANSSGLPIIAVDIPSGLSGETGHVEGEAIEAKETAFLELPKVGLFLEDGWNHVGKLRHVPFGLPHEYIEETEAELIMLSSDIMRPLLPPIIPNRHKYQRGFVIGLAGSPGMPGAAILSSLASLRGGAGIIRLLFPDGMQNELAASPYELIKMAYTYDKLDPVIEIMNRASATFIGPGMGRTADAANLLRTVLPKLQKPCVIDADALFILSVEDIPLPENTILTPHGGELARLLKLPGPPALTMDYLKKCKEYAESKRITLLLKGAPTFIFHPDETIMVHAGGDPGMATAGSGDVLTGLLAALLAQGIHPKHAAPLGVYLHGLAGEHAAREYTSYCMTASDIIQFFPEAFQFITL